MLTKTVTIRNTNNVLIQIPSFVIRELQLTTNDQLEVFYDGKQVIVAPKRSSPVEDNNGLVKRPSKTGNKTT